MARRNYDVDSVRRALDHHVETGALHSVDYDAEHARFTVSYDQLRDSESLTLREAFALALGLRRGQVTYGYDRPIAVPGDGATPWRDINGRLTTDPRCESVSPNGQRCLKRVHAGTRHEGATAEWIT